jgi:hypothetical protein
LDSGPGTHPSTSAVAQATPQLEDGSYTAIACSARWHSKAQERTKGSKDKQARKKRPKHSEANVTQAGGSVGAVLKAQKHDMPWFYGLV